MILSGIFCLLPYWSVILGDYRIPYYFPMSSWAWIFILAVFLFFIVICVIPISVIIQRDGLDRILPPMFYCDFLCWMGEYWSLLFLWENICSRLSYGNILWQIILFLILLSLLLPGCFQGEAVNGSLWTMKVEILLYITVPIVYYLMKRFRPFPVFIVIFIFSTLYNELFYYLNEKTGNEIFGILKKTGRRATPLFLFRTLVLLCFDYFRRYIKFLFRSRYWCAIFRYDVPLLIYVEPLAFAVVLIGVRII